jgi:hypothetical protein
MKEGFGLAYGGGKQGKVDGEWWRKHDKAPQKRAGTANQTGWDRHGTKITVVQKFSHSEPIHRKRASPLYVFSHVSGHAPHV